MRRCRELDVRIDEAWGLLRQAQESSRLNPRRSRPADLEDIGRSLHLLEQAVAEALSLARTVATSATDANVWDDSFRVGVAAAAPATAEGLDAGDPDRSRRASRRAERLAGDLSDDAARQVAWQEYGGLLVNLRNIVDAGVELARWSSDASATSHRSRRYDVSKSVAGSRVRRKDPTDGRGDSR